MIFILLLLILQILNIQAFNVVGWYVNNGKDIENLFPPEKLNFSIYTHIKSNTPYVFPNGTAICDKNDIITPKIVSLAKKFNVKVQWGLGFNYNPANENKTQITNYLNSIKSAAVDCNIDGIEVDYEWHNNNWGKVGFIPPELSNKYSMFLKNIKLVLGQKSVVSADVTGWGVYILGFLPWINVTMLNNGDFDFINVMSYYWSENGSLFRWEKDIELYRDIWKINPKKINLGVPYFSMNKTFLKTYGQPSWKILSKKCPNIDSKKNSCDDILFVGKEMNMNIGKLIKKNGFGGVFPWAANYDSIKNNNSLINWLYRGLY